MDLTPKAAADERVAVPVRVARYQVRGSQQLTVQDAAEILHVEGLFIFRRVKSLQVGLGDARESRHSLLLEFRVVVQWDELARVRQLGHVLGVHAGERAEHLATDALRLFQRHL